MDIYQKAYDKALSLLKIRVHSTVEIQRKLQMRGFSKDIIDQVVQELLNLGLLNDQQFAETYLDSLVRFKTFGFYMLKAKLMQRGVPGNDAENLLKEKFSLEDEKVMALRVVEKEKSGDKDKLIQKLSRKGFRSEVINAVISNK